MALRWPLLLVLVLAAVAVAAYFALRRGRHGWQGELPLLARSYRLTELPEYQRAIRWHERVAIVALVSSIVAVVALIGATTRPAWTYEPRKDAGDTPYVDIMLCFGQEFSLVSSGDDGIVPLLNVLRDQVSRFGNQRIGMTHEFYRVFPVTADHRWVTERLDAIIGLVNEYNSPNSRGYLVEDDLYDRFPSVKGVAVDALAMCTMGLPSVGSDNGRGRMILYFGSIADFDDPNPSLRYDTPPTRLYPRATLEKAIKSGRIELNAIVPGTRDQRPVGFVEQLIKDTGGKEIHYSELDYLSKGKASQLRQDNLKEELSNAVDKILSNPPPSALDQTRLQAARSFQWDVPDVFLQIALLAAVALGAARLGMRL